MNIKDSYIHNGEAILKDILVSGSKLQKLKAGKDANDAYLTWVDVLDLTPFGASGHNHDDRYFKLTGNGTTNPLTGSIYIKDVNGIVFNPNDKDLNIWEVCPNWSNTYGFNLQYVGSGYGNDNDLVLWAHNQNGIHIETYRVKQDGTFIFKVAPKVGTNVMYHAGNLTPKTITLSTTAQTYITVGSTDYTIKMPSTDPYTSARTPTAHNHYATTYKDSRNTAMTPTEGVAVNGIAIDFKTKANGVGAGSGDYCGLVTFDPYSDYTGGYPLQIGFNTGLDTDNTNEMYIRTAKNANTWNSWRTIITSGNIGSQSVNKATYASNVGTSGTAGTNYVTAANVISMYNWYNTITSTDPASNTAIDKWNEIVSFLSGITDTSTLSGILAGYAAAEHNHDGKYIKWGGSAADTTAMGWGTLTTANGYNILSHTSSSDGGDWGMVNKGGKIYMLLDGYYYQNEGQYRVTDVSETVTALSTNGNYLTWTKNGSTNNITVPYATSAAKSICNSFDTASQITMDYIQWTNNSGCSDVPSMSYAAVLNVGSGTSRLWQIWNRRSDHQLFWRPEKSDLSGWADVHTLIDDKNYTSILDNRYYTETEADNRFVNISGDTMTGALTVPANGLIVNSDGRDGAKRVIKAYGSAASHDGTYYLNFGDNPTSGNCGEIGFTYSGSGSSSNKIAMGFYGGNYLTYYYNGSSPGKLTVGTTSNYHTVLTSGNTYITNGYGVINGTTITLVSNADTVDNAHLSMWYKHATAYPYGKSNKPWHKIATFQQSTNSMQINTSIAFYVSEFYSSKSYGIFTVRARAEQNNSSLSWLTVDFMVNSGISTSDIVATWKNIGNNVIVINVYANRTGWSSYSFRKIEEQNWGTTEDTWITLNAINGNENCYASIPSDENLIISENIDISNNVASATYASSAGNAATATNVAWSGVSNKPAFTTWEETSSTSTYSLSNAAWTNTISLPSTAGSYILNITSGNSTLTGVFSIGVGEAKDEISLHLNGNGPRLYARTNGTTLQLSSSDTNATSRLVTIKYRRMI